MVWNVVTDQYKQKKSKVTLRVEIKKGSWGGEKG